MWIYKLSTGNQIQAQYLSEALKINTSLTLLILTCMELWIYKLSTGNNIESSGAQYLSEALKVNTSLTQLDLKCMKLRIYKLSTVNNIDVSGWLSIANALKTNLSIVKLRPFKDVTIEKIRFQNLLSKEILNSLPTKGKEWVKTLNDFAKTGEESLKGIIIICFFMDFVILNYWIDCCRVSGM